MSTPLVSDLKIDASKFHSDKISEKTKKWNEALMSKFDEGPKWWEVGPAKYREMRWNGETPWPRPVISPRGKDITLPSRDQHRTIPCRIFAPESAKPTGLFLHIHGGGWVLNTEHYQDALLEAYTRSAVTVISVGYRKAPEDPYPAGNEDCVDIAEWLVDHGKKQFGAELQFVGGESAGAHLSVVTCFKLLETRPQLTLRGLVLGYGAYELAGLLPQAWHFNLPLLLSREIMQRFIDAYVPNRDILERQDPWISPFYANLTRMKLPPSLFLCGTEDVLLDDNVLFSAKWAMSGAESILKIYPGAAHGFTAFPIGLTETTEDALKDIDQFIRTKSED